MRTVKGAPIKKKLAPLPLQGVNSDRRCVLFKVVFFICYFCRRILMIPFGRAICFNDLANDC